MLWVFRFFSSEWLCGMFSWWLLCVSVSDILFLLLVLCSGVGGVNVFVWKFVIWCVRCWCVVVMNLFGLQVSMWCCVNGVLLFVICRLWVLMCVVGILFLWVVSRCMCRFGWLVVNVCSLLWNCRWVVLCFQQNRFIGVVSGCWQVLCSRLCIGVMLLLVVSSNIGVVVGNWNLLNVVFRWNSLFGCVWFIRCWLIWLLLIVLMVIVSLCGFSMVGLQLCCYRCFLIFMFRVMCWFVCMLVQCWLVCRIRVVVFLLVGLCWIRWVIGLCRVYRGLSWFVQKLNSDGEIQWYGENRDGWMIVFMGVLYGCIYICVYMCILNWIGYDLVLLYWNFYGCCYYFVVV